MRKLRRMLSSFLSFALLLTIFPNVGIGVNAAQNDHQNWDFTNVTKEMFLSHWKVKNENANAWNLTADGLTLTGCSGDISVSGVNLGAYQNMFYIDTDGNYTMDTKIDFSENIQGSGGKSVGLLIYQDDSNFVKFYCQRVNGGRMYLQGVTDGGSEFEYAASYTDTGVYLKIKKIENVYSFYYSHDGTTFTKLGVDLLRDYNTPKLALIVARNQDTPITFTYKYLNFTPVTQRNWDFTNTTKAELESSWGLKSENSSAWSIGSNGLSFAGCTGDLGAGTSNYQNMLYTTGDGEYILDTKIEFSEDIAGSGGKSSGIIIWNDDNNFLKFACQRVNGGRAYLQQVIDGTQEFEYAKSYTGTSIYMRVKKVQDTYSFYFSSDGVAYTKLGTDVTSVYDAPKIALLTTRNNDTPITFTYKYLNFSNIMPKSSDFTRITSEILKANFNIKNEDANAWSISSDGLSLTSCSGGLVAKEFVSSIGAPENIFNIPADGDFIVDTKIDFSEDIAGSGGKSAALLIYQDDENFLKLACQRVNGGRMYLQGLTSGVTDLEQANAYTGTGVYLRIKKLGSIYSFYYSNDGTKYTKLGQDVTKEFNSPKVALNVERNTDNPITFTYKYLNFSDVKSDEITLNIETVRLKTGDTFKIYSTSGKTNEEFTFVSDDTDVASVSSDGTITAKAEGYALIEVTNTYGGFQTVAVSVVSKEVIYSTHEGNPYLPLWEFVPDGEPYVFEDPDNKGSYRVYIYGSHDHRGDDKWCGLDHVVWSAPVDDLSAWRYDGILYEPLAGATTQMNAPDVVEVVNTDGTKFYCLYPNSIGDGAANSVAFSDRPDGPFKVKEGTNGIVYGDPAVLVDDDGRVYAYWGSEAGSKCAELDPETMCTVKEGTTIKANLPGIAACNSDDFDPSLYNIVVDGNERKFRFFEASSIRKVGNKYVMIWARAGDNQDLGGTRQHLAYGYSDSPLGPWKYGGNIVSSGGEAVLNADGSYSGTYMSTNIHGSICQINDQWYIFYHRGLHGIKPRQAMVEPINLEINEASVENGGYVRISHVETTSNGFSVHGLDPYREHSAGLVSYLTGFSAEDKPFTANYSKDVSSLPISNIKNGVIAGFKYFNFDKTIDSNITTLNLKLCPKGEDATIDVYARPVNAVNTPVAKTNGVITSVGDGSFKIGTLNLSASMMQTMTEFEVDVSGVNELNGKWGIFLVFSSSSSDVICDFDTLKFVSDMSAQISDIAITDNKVNVVSVENIVDLPQGTVLYVGVYDETRRCLKEICSVTLNNESLTKGIKNITLPKTLTVENTDIVKAYIWGSNNSPLSK